MNEITQIRKLSLWIFFIPFIAINICLIISQNYQLFENSIFKVDMIGRSGFSIPYLDGSLSISRASRTFPQYLIFKPAMILTSVLVYFYWVNNNKLVNKYRFTNISYKFKIFGILSAIFLTLHSIFLGIKFDIQIYKLMRRVVLLLFIIFEILDKETGISPGQACVFYSSDEIGDKVLGGGWIYKTFNKNLST